jgi:5'-nucleotidase (lipoprotein e(P4) family)
MKLPTEYTTLMKRRPQICKQAANQRHSFRLAGLKFLSFFLLLMACLMAIDPACPHVSAQSAPSKKAYTLKDLNEQLVMATLWVQVSAEYRALCLQAYNFARMTLDKDLAEVKTDKKRIIIVDTDDTTIQANEYEAYVIGKDLEYPSQWSNWVATAIGKAVPGAVEFLNYAASKGVEPYYVTNRKIDQEYQGTLDNYKKLGCPFVDTEHVMCRQKGANGDKQARQIALEEKYHLVLYVGDNIEDFPVNIYGKSIEERYRIVESVKDEFGKRFIMLPNPMYGSWENAVKNFKKDLPAEEQNRLRKALLRQWRP